jgi:hypothetical protein
MNTGIANSALNTSPVPATATGSVLVSPDSSPGTWSSLAEAGRCAGPWRPPRRCASARPRARRRLSHIPVPPTATIAANSHAGRGRPPIPPEFAGPPRSNHDRTASRPRPKPRKIPSSALSLAASPETCGARRPAARGREGVLKESRGRPAERRPCLPAASGAYGSEGLRHSNVSGLPDWGYRFVLRPAGCGDLRPSPQSFLAPPQRADRQHRTWAGRRCCHHIQRPRRGDSRPEQSQTPAQP